MRMDMKRKDDLLPLLSHAQFKEDLDAFVLAPEQRPHSLLFVGLDLFKEINDSFGHEAGDEVLQKVARELSSASAGIGDSYRRGGDEMAIVLPNCGLQEATAIAEGVRARVENLSFERCNEKVTVSIGIASYPETVSERSRLFGLAATMMYRAKDCGGNCICVPAVPGQAGEKIIPEGTRYMRGDITSRVEAVEIWMSINALSDRRYDIRVTNDNDEEVTVEAVNLKYGGLYLCNFSQPEGPAVIGPRSNARIQGCFASGPVDTLRSKLGRDFSDRQTYEFDIVMRGRVLGRMRTFSHTILATMAMNGYMSQFSPQ